MRKLAMAIYKNLETENLYRFFWAYPGPLVHNNLASLKRPKSFKPDLSSCLQNQRPQNGAV